MKHLKSFEEITPVEYVAPKKEHPSYKSEIKKKKRRCWYVASYGTTKSYKRCNIV